MLKEYLGNNAYRYTLTSGSEITLTIDELNELIENSPLVEKIADLEQDIKYLREEAKEYAEEVRELNNEIAKLEKQI